jgi:hypothetical protein
LRPSRTFTTIASMKIAAQVSSKGLTAQSFISSITLSVIRLIVSLDKYRWYQHHRGPPSRKVERSLLATKYAVPAVARVPYSQRAIRPGRTGSQVGTYSLFKPLGTRPKPPLATGSASAMRPHQ